MGRAILISGPIGAGKTTVCAALVDLWSGPLARIEGDSFWPFFAKPKPGGRADSFRTLMRAMTAAAVPFARSGYDVLLDFSVPPAFLATARVILKEIELDFVLIRPSLQVCASRAADRPIGKIAEYDRGFYAMFEGRDRHAVCNDQADVAAVAVEIFDGLSSGRFRVEG
jgi:chloramphenicol 3-O-phosphotransferase